MTPRLTDAATFLLESDEDILSAVQESSTIAVLGIKPESHAHKAAHYVPAYMKDEGYEIIPVPVYYPDVVEILGAPVHRLIAAIERPIDMVNVFRRSEDIPPHVDDIIAAMPRFVWFQLGIRNDAAAQRLAEAGIRVVQDRCLLVEHGKMKRVLAGSGTSEVKSGE